MLAHINSGDHHRVAVTCTLLHRFCKCYDQATGGAERALDMLLTPVIPSVYSVADYMIKGDNSPLAAEILRLVLKCMHCCVEFHLSSHPVFCAVDKFGAWCLFANAVLTKKLPDPRLGEAGEPAGMPADDDARERWGWWRAKKWAVKVFHRLADRWGQPAFHEEVHVKAVAATFNKYVAPEVVRGILASLHDWRKGGRALPRKYQLYALHTLTACTDFASCWKGVLQPAVPFLLQAVIFHLFRMSGEELEAFAHDPADYLRSSDDPIMNHVSPRKAAEVLLHSLAKVRRAVAGPIIDATIMGGLGAYAAATAGPAGAAAAAAATGSGSAADPVTKEALLYLVQVCRNHLCRTKARRAAVEPMLAAHVIPELRSAHPPLRARAAAVIASYMAVLELSEASTRTAVESLVALLDDRYLAVKVVAGGVLTFFLRYSEGAQALLAPVIPHLLDRLFALLDEIGVDEVIGSVDCIIEVYAERIPDLAVAIVGKLLTVFADTLKERDEEDGGLADEASLAGEGALTAIRSVIDALLESKRMDVLLAVIGQVWPLLTHVFDADGSGAVSGVYSEFYEAAFDMAGDIMIALGPEVPPGTPALPDPGQAVPLNPEPWKLYLRMMATYSKHALDYTMSLIVSLCRGRSLMQPAVPPSTAASRLLCVCPATSLRPLSCPLFNSIHPPSLPCLSLPLPLCPLPPLQYPVDTLMSYAPERFSAPVDPATGADNARVLCEAAAFVEGHADEHERGLFTRLIIGLLHNCRGRVDRLLPGIVTLYAKAVCTGHTQLLRSQAGAVLGTCLMYSVPGTLAALEAQAPGAAAAVLTALYDGAAKGYFKRSLDCKLAVMGLVCLLGTPLASLPPGVASITPQTLAVVAALDANHADWAAREAEARKEQEEAEADFEDGDDDDDDDITPAQLRRMAARAATGDSDDEDDDDDEAAAGTGGAGEDHDYVHEEDAAYHAMLDRRAKEDREKAAAAAAGGAAAGGAGAAAEAPKDLPPGDDDVDPSASAETPIDHLNHRLWLQDALAALAAQPEAAPLQAATPDAVKAALGTLVADAARQRAAGAVAGALGPAPPAPPAAADAAAPGGR